MKGIILAAGRGSRMGRLTDAKPKGFLEVQGRSLINRQIEAFNLAGINEVAVVTGYKGSMFRELPVQIFHNHEWATSNMFHSLCMAKTWLGMYECIISYSDIFYKSSAIEALTQCGDDIALTYDTNWHALWSQRFENPLDDAETFKLDTESNLTEIGEQPEKILEICGQYMGLFKISPAGWKVVEQYNSKLEHSIVLNSHMTDVFRYIIQNDLIKIRGIPYSETWGEVDSEQDLKLYNGWHNLD